MAPKIDPAPTPERVTSQWLRDTARAGGWGGRLAIAVPLAGGALLLVQAYVLATILHRAIVEAASINDVTPLVLAFAALIAARVGLGVGAEIFAVASGETIKRQVRTVLVGNLLDRKPTWTAAHASGGLSGLVVEQVEAMEGYFVRYVPAMIQAAVLPLAFAAAILPVDWVVGLLFLVTAPLIPVFMALAGLGAEAASRVQATALARLSGRFADRLRGLVTLRLFGREAAEVASVRDASEELRSRTMRVMRIAFLASAVLEFFAALGVAGVALYVGLTLLDLVSLRSTPLTLQAGLFCLLMAPEIYQPLRLLAAHYHDRASARAALAEITATLGALPAPEARPVPIVATPRDRRSRRPMRLELRQFSVATPTGRPVLAHVGLTVAAGSHIAILGPSGCGKSTLIEAIARFRDHDGVVLLDGQLLERAAETEFRQRVAFLGQRPQLFAGSIADNIRLGRVDACDTAVEVAARRACVLQFAGNLPLGLGTVLGENGLGLSGGEIQRIALARIYLRDPGLVILDEPTAHLDRKTEAEVLAGLAEFTAHRTLIIATHSLTVAAEMDMAWRIAGEALVPALKPRARSRQLEYGAA